MPPKLIALGVIAIVLSIMMMIIAPPQDTTHHSADAGDFAKLERRGWDSNPGYGYPYNSFRV